jgi:hypothetical protein
MFCLCRRHQKPACTEQRARTSASTMRAPSSRESAATSDCSRSRAASQAQLARARLPSVTDPAPGRTAKVLPPGMVWVEMFLPVYSTFVHSHFTTNLIKRINFFLCKKICYLCKFFWKLRFMVYIRVRNRNRSQNRNCIFSKVWTGTVTCQKSEPEPSKIVILFLIFDFLTFVLHFMLDPDPEPDQPHVFITVPVPLRPKSCGSVQQHCC